ncbi:hypothetical protein [Desulfocurvibacter africanus]|uniref:hypothetical protein n=1 Tax=Desulfocurvibacter africanus TaxID=873 RepID=UPI00110C4997|nr:hypothetical protein [Desulfocurvibacter africanus]
MSEQSHPSARGGPFRHADPAFGLGSASRRLTTRNVPSGTMFKKCLKVNMLEIFHKLHAMSFALTPKKKKGLLPARAGLPTEVKCGQMGDEGQRSEELPYTPAKSGLSE